MPGANYMGGKRSAIKARVKDTVGRTQKGFFGRQRLDMLSQGLSASKLPEKSHLSLRPLASNRGHVEIDLAHARQKTPLDENTAGGWFIPSPIHILPSTPRSRKRVKTQKAHTSSSRASRSEILDVLDTSDPLSLRGALDRIVAMPDLAGLAKREEPSLYSSKRLDQRTWNERKVVRKSKALTRPEEELTDIDFILQIPDEDEEDSDPRSMIKLRKHPTANKFRPRPLSKYHTPPAKREGHRRENRPPLSYKYHQWNSGRSSMTREAENSEDERSSANSKDDFKIHDSGFSDFRVEKNAYSSPWSMQQRQSSSRTSKEANMSFQSKHDAPSKIQSTPSSNMPTANSSSPGVSGLEQNESHGQSHSECDKQVKGLPSSIKLGPIKRGGPRNVTNLFEDGPSVYGTLFEQSDPWMTVGFILGLDETGSEMTRISSEILAVRGVYQAEHKIAVPELPSHFTKVLLEEAREPDEWMMSETDPDPDCWLDSPFLPDSRTNPILTPRNNIVEIFSPMPLNDFEDWGIHEGASPLSSEEVDVDSLLGDIKVEAIHLIPKHQDDLALERTPSPGKHFSSPRKEKPEPMDGSQMIDMRPYQNDQSSPDSSESQPDDIMDDNLLDDSYSTSHHILAVPVLREVDGRFLGPSLFDDFDESEDDS